MPRSVTIALIQARAGRDKTKNLERHAGMARNAIRRGARVVCFPELFATYYVGATEDKRWFAEAEGEDGPTVETFRRIAKESKTVFVVPFFERDGRAFYNSAAVVDADGRLSGVFRKVHLPHLKTAHDAFYFKPGNRGFAVFETAYLKLSVLICHDRHFPESFRLAALAGAEAIFVPTASGRGVSDAFWEAEGQAAAIANGVFVAALNKVGREPNAPTPYYGRAYVADPFGRILFQGGDRDQIVMGKIDLGRIAESRAMWSLLEDRRLDVYRPILAPWPKGRRARQPT
ncbi:MAG: nitrilase-related carbon-nitrogen hydrolase [Planctomycetota bacterium]